MKPVYNCVGVNFLGVGLRGVTHYVEVLGDMG